MPMSVRAHKRLGVELLRHLGRQASRPPGIQAKPRPLAHPHSTYSRPITPSVSKLGQQKNPLRNSRAARIAPLTLLAGGGLLATVFAISQPSTDHHFEDAGGAAEHATDTRDPSLPRFRLSTIRAHDASHPQPWVTHSDKVYDITAWVPAHPGGDVILRAAGGSIDPYWDIFTIHKKPHVAEILAQYLIGYIDTTDLVDGRPPADAIEDPFSGDPERDARLVTHTARPRNAEPGVTWLTQEFLTPAELFYVRNHMWVPIVGSEGEGGKKLGNATDRGSDSKKLPDPDTADSHVLAVELPDGETRTYTLAELRRRFRHHTVTAALQCSGNRRSDMTRHVGTTNGLQWGAGAISNAEWEGVRLADVLADAGLRVVDPATLTVTPSKPRGPDSTDDSSQDQNANLVTSPGAHHIHFHGLEAYSASIPLPTALDPRADVLLAFGMNGAPLPRDHGFPLRALVPGHVAARSVKWLSRIVVSDEEATSQWQRRDYKSFGPNEGANPDWDRAAAIQEMPVTSAITGVWVGECARERAVGVGEKREDVRQKNRGVGRDAKGEPVALQGYAYSGGGREIRRVDVSLDGGLTWDQATLVDDCATPATAETSSAPPCKGSKVWAWKRWRYAGQLPALSRERDVGEDTAAHEDANGSPIGPHARREADGRYCTTLVVKATDDAYNAQPRTHAEIYNVRGNLATAWHRVRLCPSCSVEKNGGGSEQPRMAWRTGQVSGCGFAAAGVDGGEKRENGKKKDKSS